MTYQIIVMKSRILMLCVTVIVLVTSMTERVDTVHPNDYPSLGIECKDHMIKVIISAETIIVSEHD